MSSGASPAPTAALHCSRIGAAHRRQGRPCQDFSLSHRCHNAAGEPVLVLAVADGHGGARYRRSERGSRLACELAIAEVERAMGPRATDEPRQAGQGGIAADSADLAHWRRWLAQELPEAIHRLWLEAIAVDWERDPEGADPCRPDPYSLATTSPAAVAEAPEGGCAEGFSPLSYGTTLGLVVIGPRWWGHTGLGDWDLVRVEAAGGGASLISEEPAGLAAGEATCSLCQRQAARLFAPRSGLYPRRDGEAFALVLSSDGIRKSCATDADFLALAAHLAATPAGESELLESALDQISREGSGDDVSVAIAQLGVAPPDRAQNQDRQTQPSQAAAAPEPPGSGHWRGRYAVLLLALGAAVALGLALPRLIPSSRFTDQDPPAAPIPATATIPPPTPGPSPAELPLELQARLRRSIAQLCASPASIRASLKQRKSQSAGLATGRLQARQLQRNAATDPLGALLGTAFLAREPQQTLRPLQALGACPELEAALAATWPAGPADRRMGPLPAHAGPAGSSRPTAPPP
ncbi:protein phosphatase 2C domain-containing protein [Vulcanococcus limneticus]|uniref:protein phosphatase 2C domain-containing protein n=1 Tax=Vulcanococcus limneticus TaxID=2170428 RepID=UPI00398BC02B